LLPKWYCQRVLEFIIPSDKLAIAGDRTSQSPKLVVGGWYGAKYDLAIAQSLLQADHTYNQF
jgi:hypothetical protein